MINAAGVLFLAGEDPRNLLALLVRRTAEGDHGGEWSIPGGKIEEGETAEEAAFRECWEEIGIDDLPGELTLHARRIRDGVDYTTFTCRVPEPFEVTLNEEHDAFEWVPVGSLSGVEEGRSDAEFNEADHPRDSDGKFGSGSNYTEYSGKIRAYNKTDPSHLKHVIAEMRKIGPPEIRVVKTKNGVTAIEGSHRLEAAKKLGLRPKVKFITPDEKVKLSDLGDIAGDVYASFTPEGGLRNGEVTGKELVEFVESGDGRNINFHKDKARFDYASPFKVIRAETVRDGEAAGYYDPTTKTIHLATHLRLGDGLRELSNPARLEAHEIGHAVDHSLGWASHDPAFTTLLEPARDLLEPEEVIGADYYLGDAEEAFAEAYAYLRGPAEGARYFGTLEPGRAGEAMGEIIGWVKNRISSA